MASYLIIPRPPNEELCELIINSPSYFRFTSKNKHLLISDPSEEVVKNLSKLSPILFVPCEFSKPLPKNILVLCKHGAHIGCPDCAHQLNGNNGTWTNTDDVFSHPYYASFVFLISSFVSALPVDWACSQAKYTVDILTQEQTFLHEAVLSNDCANSNGFYCFSNMYKLAFDDNLLLYACTTGINTLSSGDPTEALPACYVHPTAFKYGIFSGQYIDGGSPQLFFTNRLEPTVSISTQFDIKELAFTTQGYDLDYDDTAEERVEFMKLICQPYNPNALATPILTFTPTATPTLEPTALPTLSPTAVPTTLAPTMISRKLRGITVPPTSNNTHTVASQLNGNNGSWTNTDDVKRRSVITSTSTSTVDKPTIRRTVVVSSANAGGPNPRRRRNRNTRNTQRRRRPANSRAKSVTQQCGAPNDHTNIHKYLQLSMNPVDRGLPLVGVPRLPSYASAKRRGFVEFDITIGSAGIGFLGMQPATTNDANCIIYSLAGFSGSSMPANGSAGAGYSTTAFNNLPFATSSLDANDLMARIVSCGAQWTYTGTTLNEGGSEYSLTLPNYDTNSDMQGYTVSSMTSRDGVVSKNVSRSKTGSIALHHTSYANADYNSSTAYPWTSDATQVLGGLLIQSIPGNTFHVKASIIVEYCGTDVDGWVTDNPIAPAGGYERAVEVMHRTTKIKQGNPDITPAELASAAVTAYKTGKAIYKTPIGKMGITDALSALALI